MYRITIIAFCILLSTNVWAKTWTSANGRHTIEADLVRVDGKNVVLKNAKGKQIRLPLSKLSPEDQQYVVDWQKKNSSNTDSLEPKELPPVKGELFGKPFQADKIELQRNGILTFQVGDDLIADDSLTLFLFLKGDSIGGKKFKVTPLGGASIFLGGTGVPHVSMESKQDGKHKHETVTSGGYSMNLQFGPWKDDATIAKIQLSVPKHKTKLSGQFRIERPIDPTATPTAKQLPHVSGKVNVRNAKRPIISAGYVGLKSDGKIASNLIFMTLTGSIFQNKGTTVAQNEGTTIFVKKGSVGFNHVKLDPGRYFFYVKWNNQYVEGKWLDIKADTAEKLPLEIDALQAGSLEVQAGSLEVDAFGQTFRRVELILLDVFPNEAQATKLGRHMGIWKELEDGVAEFDSLRPGKYRVRCGKRETLAEVKAGDLATVTLE